MVYALLFFIALCPAVFYMFYIMAFDHRKPEPPKALLLSAFLGIIVALIVMLNLPLQLSSVHIEDAHSVKESLIIGLFKLALPSELAKWLVLCVFLSLNRFYDEYIDGIVYSVCLAMGYAGIVGTMFLYGYVGSTFVILFEISAITIFILIPIHYVSGTIMGYFLALARTHRKIPNHALALLLPILIDGLLCSVVLLIGRHWSYYFIMGVIFPLSAMVVYTQIFHLLELDGAKTGSQ